MVNTNQKVFIDLIKSELHPDTKIEIPQDVNWQELYSLRGY